VGRVSDDELMMLVNNGGTTPTECSLNELPLGVDDMTKFFSVSSLFVSLMRKLC
jgi:hypothetical protein